jgi:hypothetical protein
MLDCTFPGLCVRNVKLHNLQSHIFQVLYLGEISSRGKDPETPAMERLGQCITNTTSAAPSDKYRFPACPLRHIERRKNAGKDKMKVHTDEKIVYGQDKKKDSGAIIPNTDNLPNIP